MKRAIRFGCSVTQLPKAHGVRARISSLADAGVPAQYRLPLTLLHPASQTLKYDDAGQFVQLPPRQFQEHPRRTTLLIACHVTDQFRIENCACARQAQDLPNSQSRLKIPFSAQLWTEVLSENVEPPKPDKPKWDDEQYPDIGKSTLRLDRTDYSDRYYIKPTPIHPHPTSPENDIIL